MYFKSSQKRFITFLLNSFFLLLEAKTKQSEETPVIEKALDVVGLFMQITLKTHRKTIPPGHK